VSVQFEDEDESCVNTIAVARVYDVQCTAVPSRIQQRDVKEGRKAAVPGIRFTTAV
jgi:hypothetical protein